MQIRFYDFYTDWEQWIGGVKEKQEEGDVNRWLFSDDRFRVLTTRAPNYFLSLIYSIAHPTSADN